ncbi:MAG: hypothetical protein QOF27_962 [Gaiellaceae bacterium]|jgi:hypothetical protein|nr:hypothetical protein [Gaiellaceae bacterium]
MKHLGLIALLVIGAAAAAATAGGREASTPSAARCGGTLWRLKTFSDSRRMSVHLPPAATTVADVGKRPFPRPLPRERRTPFQRQAWEVVAQITQYRLESGGVRLVLFDAGSYLNAVLPVPDCLSARTRARDQILGAWRRFMVECGRPTVEWQSLGAIAYVRGLGFWGGRGATPGSARNGAQLYPVTNIRIVAGC